MEPFYIPTTAAQTQATSRHPSTQYYKKKVYKIYLPKSYGGKPSKQARKPMQANHMELPSVPLSVPFTYRIDHQPAIGLILTLP